MEIQPVTTHALQTTPQAAAVTASSQTKGDSSVASVDTAAAIRKTEQSTAIPKEPAASAKELKDAIDKIEKVVQPVAQDLNFSIDEDTGKTVVKVIDSGTKEVIRQIPSEELIAIAHALDKLQGLLVKQKV